MSFQSSQHQQEDGDEEPPPPNVSTPLLSASGEALNNDYSHNPSLVDNNDLLPSHQIHNHNDISALPRPGPRTPWPSLRSAGISISAANQLSTRGIVVGPSPTAHPHGKRSSVSNDPDLMDNATLSFHGSTYMLAQYLQQHEQQEQDQPQDAAPQQQSLSALVHAALEESIQQVDQEEEAGRSQSPEPPQRRSQQRSLSSSRRLSHAINRSVLTFQPSWWERFVTSLPPGSLAQSTVIAVAIALVNGVGCFLYYEAMEWGLEFVWKTVPQDILELNASSSWCWIPTAGLTMSVALGLAVVYLGEPGDMPFTVACVHQKGFIPIDHVLPMVVASYFSIMAGASLGPEAPLVAICGALGGWVSRTLFLQSVRHVVRKHTLMGMAGALAAFFGAPFGGSLFALEICNRFGVEYFEDLMPSIWCGELTLLVFRALTQVKIGPIWQLSVPTIATTTLDDLKIDLWTIPVGALLGLIGAGLAYIFAVVHTHYMKLYSALGLLDNSRAVYRALLGGFFVYVIGLAIPHTMFWAEEELSVVVMQQPASHLPHVWPTSGLFGFESDTAGKTALVGLAKLVAISCSLAQGARGGFIFPFFFAGGAVGRALADVVPFLTVPIASLCVAAGTNTAITRTALATTLILVFLSGELSALPAVLMASLTSLFTTGTIKFIKTQMARSDIDHSMYHLQPKTKRTRKQPTMQRNEGAVGLLGESGNESFEDDEETISENE